MKLLISHLDWKYSPPHESHVSLDWKLQSSLTYTPRFAHVKLQFLGLRGDDSLEWWMLFILVTSSTILMLMTTFAHKTTCTQFGEHKPPTTLVMALEDVYNMDETSLFSYARPNKKLSARKISWAQNSKGLSYSCLCCKHNKDWQVETYDYLQIPIPKMLWKVVASKLCVVVCKPISMHDIIYIWESNDEPQCAFQISKTEVTCSFKHVGTG